MGNLMLHNIVNIATTVTRVTADHAPEGYDETTIIATDADGRKFTITMFGPHDGGHTQLPIPRYQDSDRRSCAK